MLRLVGRAFSRSVVKTIRTSGRRGIAILPRQVPRTRIMIAVGAIAVSGAATWHFSRSDLAAASATPAQTTATPIDMQDIDVCGVDDLKEGGLIEVPVGDARYIVTRYQGTVHCLSGKCPHAGAPLATGLETDGRVVCPWHGASFSITSGAVMHAPAKDGLAKFEVKEVDGRIHVLVPTVQPKGVSAPITTKRDPSDKRVYVIVGGGPAGVTAADYGYTGTILMISSEPNLPIDRTALSKWPNMSLTALTMRSAEFLSNADIDVRTSTVVKAVDENAKVITLGDGQTLQYDKILLASGSTPRLPSVPGVTLPNVFTLRTAQDSARIVKSAKEQEGKRVVVIGSSFIGMEAATFLRNQFKQEVTIVGMEETPFERVLGAQIGSAIRGLGESKGIKFVMQRSLAKIEGDAQTGVKAVVLDNGQRIECDTVVLGMGVVPSTPYIPIKSSIPRAPNGAIVVDPFLHAGNDVYAAGDIASFPFWLTGERVRVEHWNLAMEMGKHAAGNMTRTKHQPFLQVPFFSSFVFGEGVRYSGFAASWDEILYEGDLTTRKFVAYFVKDNRVLAVASMGRDPAVVSAMEAMRLGVMPSAAEIRSGQENAKTIQQRVAAVVPKKCCGGGCSSKTATPAKTACGCK